jgi:hypothetical protein
MLAYIRHMIASARENVKKLYVNCTPPAWHNRSCHVTRRAMILDTASVISKYGCSQKDMMC